LENILKYENMKGQIVWEEGNSKPLNVVEELATMAP
jgi:hypothetical protein